MIEQLIGEWQIKYSVELNYKQFKGLKTLLETMKHNCKGTDIDITRAMFENKRYQDAIKRAKKRAISRAIDETIKHSYMSKEDLIKVINKKLT